MDIFGIGNSNYGPVCHGADGGSSGSISIGSSSWNTSAMSSRKLVSGAMEVYRFEISVGMKLLSSIVIASTGAMLRVESIEVSRYSVLRTFLRIVSASSNRGVRSFAGSFLLGTDSPTDFSRSPEFDLNPY
jgi:hypothetical protein